MNTTNAADLTPKMARTLARLRSDRANADANGAPCLAYSHGYNYGTIKALRARGYTINETVDYYGPMFGIVEA